MNFIGLVKSILRENPKLADSLHQPSKAALPKIKMSTQSSPEEVQRISECTHERVEIPKSTIFDHIIVTGRCSKCGTYFS